MSAVIAAMCMSGIGAVPVDPESAAPDLVERQKGKTCSKANVVTTDVATHNETNSKIEKRNYSGVRDSSKEHLLLYGMAKVENED